jgi:hypothetical protein
MKKYLLLSLIFFVAISLKSQAQISFQSLDTVLFNTEENPDVRIVDIDLDDNNELIDILHDKLYSIKNFQSEANSTKNVLFELPGLRITRLSNFVDYNDDGFLDCAVIADIEQPSFKSYVIFMKGTSNGFVEDFRKEDPNISYVKFIDIEQDGSYELFYSIWEKFGYVKDWKDGFDGFDVEFSQESVSDIEALDYDNDDKLEIVSLGINSFHIYDNSEAQQFNLIYSAVPNFTQNKISYGDINLDGFTDFIYRIQDDIYSLIYNNGQFIENNLTESFGFVNVRSPFLIDIDQNNTLDIVFRDALDRLVYLKNQNGDLNQFEIIGNTGLKDINNLLFDDFDNDGYIDLLTYNFGVYDLIYTNQNQEIKEIFTGELYNVANDIATYDMDSDGKKDLISIAKYGAIDIVYDYKNNLTGEGSTFPIPRDCDNLNIHDVDEDGILDIIYYTSNISSGNSEFYVMKGLGNREFDEPILWKYVPNGTSLRETDLNNDGNIELITFRSFGSEVVIIHPNSGNVNDYYNSDNVINIQNGNGIRAIDIGDLSNNDSEDIVTANYETQNISVLINDGAGNFAESNIGIGNNVKNVRIFDYNFDGNNDLLVIAENQDTGNGNLQIYLNDGNSTFSFSEEFELDFFDPLNIDIYDFDNDGDKDLLISSNTYLVQEVFENKEGVFEMVSVDIDVSDQVYRIFDDINGDGKIDFYSVDITQGNRYIHYNNSVSKPSLDDFNITTEETGFSNVTLSQSGLSTSGYLVLLKEDSSSTLNELPEDNSFYASNSSFGIGGQIDGAYVVYSGNASSFEITDLEVSSNYRLFAFPYNSNSPNNTIISYTDDYISMGIATDSSIYLLQDLPLIEIDEDSSNEFELTDYIFDTGINTYSASTENENVDLTLESSLLKIEALNDFNGELEIVVAVENQYEERSYELNLLINPVNDAPVLQEGGLIQVEGLESTFIKLQFYDVDNTADELKIIINSSNNDIINAEDIEHEIIEDSIQLNFTPLSLGTTNITVSVSDSEFEVSSEFKVEVIELVLSNIKKYDEVRIYPNPVSDLIHLEGLNQLNYYRINSITGQKVMDGKTTSGKLDISKLEPGVYLLIIDKKQLRFIKK